MAQILVRQVDPEVVKRLKDLAKREGRSLQAQAKLILERAANASRLDPDRARELCERFRKRFRGKKFSDSTHLIRQDRER